MTCHWIGAARRAGPEDFLRAAEALDCSVAAVRAVWDVECSGGPFRADGSLERRFEPHKLRKADGTWRSSALLSTAAREAKFAAAFAADPDDALRATSWGGPQIMGFNAGAAGFVSASAMVAAMADDEGAQVGAFVALIRSWGLAATLRAEDWRGFAARYNGGANVASYAARIESALRRRNAGALRRRPPTAARVREAAAARCAVQIEKGTADGAVSPLGLSPLACGLLGDKLVAGRATRGAAWRWMISTGPTTSAGYCMKSFP